MRTYITDQYRLALSDYQTARTEQEKADALATMARLQRLASEKIGFGYADELAAMSAAAAKGHD